MIRHLTDASYFVKENIQAAEIPDLMLGALLGVGAFCVVRLGKLQSSSEIFAVKIISKKEASSVVSEVGILKKLDHRSIPKLLGTWETPETFVIGMGICPGIELGHYLMSKGSVLITEEEASIIFTSFLLQLPTFTVSRFFTRTLSWKTL
jgi:serine/threonine protein kinase